MDDEAVAYFQAVERHFIDRRGQPLLLSPEDVRRVSDWHAQGIPVEAVLEGIDIHFDRLARRKRAPRRAVTLAWIEDDVHDAWAGARRRRMGRAVAPESVAEAVGTSDDLARFVDGLTRAAGRLWEGDEACRAVAAAAEAAAEKLDRKAKLFDVGADGHDPQAAEESLRRAERSLLDAARKAVGDDAVAAIERGLEAELAEKRARMTEATWERVRRQLVDKRLRERFGLQRLSLFYT